MINESVDLTCVLCAPSGAGKSTVINHMLSNYGNILPPIFLSVSDTTRAPRPGEIDGVSYNFITREQFEYNIKNNRYLEWAEYTDNHYGTPKDPVEQYGNSHIILLELEVQGARQVKEALPDTIFVFLLPSDLAKMEQRLRKRDTETEESIQKRMNAARLELASLDEFDYIVFNDIVETAAFELASILQNELCRYKRRSARLNRQILEEYSRDW